MGQKVLKRVWRPFLHIQLLPKRYSVEDLLLGSLFDSLSHQNSRFKLFPYFLSCFGALPSAVRIILPVEGKKESIEAILNHIGLEKFSFVPVFKNWITDDSKDAKMSDDYAYEYVFKSDSGRMLIHFLSQYQSVQIQFLKTGTKENFSRPI